MGSRNGSSSNTIDLQNNSDESTTNLLGGHTKTSQRQNEDASLYVKKIASAVFYGISSFMITVVNKTVLTSNRFPSFLFLSFGQLAASIIVLGIGRRMKLVTFPSLTRSTFSKIFPLPLIFLGNMMFGLGGTQALSLPMFAALRRFSILMTMILELKVLGIRPSTAVQISVYGMIGGALLAASDDLSFNMQGYTYVMITNALTASNGVYVKKKLDTSEIGKFGLMFYNSLFMIIPALMITYITGDLNDSLNFNGWNNPYFVLQFLLSCFMGFILSYSTILCTQFNSALTTTIVGCLKNICVTYLGMFIGGDYIFSWLNCIGINISVMASLLYTYVTFRRKQTPDKELLIPATRTLRGIRTICGPRRRRFWVRPLYLDREICGFYARNFDRMYEGDAEQFFLAIRMKQEVFDLLFSLTRDKLTKTSQRKPIPAKCRLFMTLMYLAHGGSKQFFSMGFKMGLTSVKRIVNETCVAIWDNLGPIYLTVPKKYEWKRIACDFKNMWNLPNCVGSIDGKHINITCPPNAGSTFFNYKKQHSVVLLGVCDANYTFTAVDIGAYGAQSDGGVLQYSDFDQRLFNGNLDLPEDTALPGTSRPFPNFFVGDSAFPLRKYLMRPYPELLLSEDREVFNKRLSRARRVIENAFGVLVARWRILLSPLQMSPQSAEKIVMASVTLHNFVKMHDGSYCPPVYVDSYTGEETCSGLWREEVTRPLERQRRMHSNNATRTVFALRDELKDYLYTN